jgi:transposase InsO family protein
VIHVQRLQQLLEVQAAATDPPRRRGSVWQQPRRQLEAEVRQEAVAFCQWVAARGLNRIESAAWLGIAPRTLRLWEEGSRPEDRPVAARGRPVERSERAQRTAVLALLESVGPGVGLAVLQGAFPALPRAELHDLLGRYRRVWVARHHQVLHVLHWQQPGSVWAIDYAEPPQPLEEGFTDLLAVRDLASGMQLLWLPVAEATAATTVAALEGLFALYGPPLVLKLDNGSPFVAARTQELLAAWEVVPLYSPPGLPAYNGAIEAGIGALKVRTYYQAARQGRPGEWTCADAEAARQQANEVGRPWGPRGPTPAEPWAGRQPVTAEERAGFQGTVSRLADGAPGPGPAGPVEAAGTSAHPEPAAAGQEGAGRGEERSEPRSPAARGSEQGVVGAPSGAAGPACPAGAPPAEARCGGALGAAQDRAANQREAIGRALVAHGYLLFTRRRIPLPIKRKKVA